MRAITQQGHSDDPKRVAVLVALQCASKMLASQELNEKYQESCQRMLGVVTEGLACNRMNE